MDDNKICARCGEPEIDKDGMTVFFGDLCEYCHQRQEYRKIIEEDDRRYMDWDQSMNH